MWYKQFVRFHGLRHPDEMGDDEITAFFRQDLQDYMNGFNKMMTAQ